jgi:tetratricopeptide (TPR) repeat protein
MLSCLEVRPYFLIAQFGKRSWSVTPTLHRRLVNLLPHHGVDQHPSWRTFGRALLGGLLLGCLTVAWATPSLEERLTAIADLLQKGQLQPATAALDEVQAEFPKDPRIHNFRGVLNVQQERFDAAESAFRTAIDFAPGFIGAYLNLGRLLQQRATDSDGIYKALAVYEALLKVDAANDEAPFQAARLLLRLGRFQDSLKRLSQLPTMAQRRAVVLSTRCAALAGSGDIAGAEATAGELLGSADFSETDVLSILPILAAASRHEIAARLLEGLGRMGRHSFETRYQLGLTYQKLRKLTEARAAMESAFQERPGEARILVNLAQIAHEQKDLKGALGYLAHARDLEPENADIHFFFGIVSVEMDLPLEAKSSLLEAVRLAPDRPFSRYALGSVLLGERNAEPSIEHFKRFRELLPDDPRGPLSLGMAYFKTHEFELAAAELKVAANQTSTAATAHYYLGRIKLQYQENSAAVEAFQEAIQINPKYAEAYADLGVAYTRMKEMQRASEAAHRAVELDPDGYRANLNLLFYYERTRDSRATDQKAKVEQIKAQMEEGAKVRMRRIETRQEDVVRP